MYMSEFCCYVYVERLTAITSGLPMKPGRTRNAIGRVETETAVHYESQHQSH